MIKETIIVMAIIRTMKIENNSKTVIGIIIIMIIIISNNNHSKGFIQKE